MRNSERNRVIAQWGTLLFLSLAAGSISAQPQDQPSATSGLSSSQEASPPVKSEVSSENATPLAKLIEEAEHNNPQILAARHVWKAATLVPSQASAPPDPQVTVQQFAVGSPRPFAGFSNSDFAYIGLGISQDLPYPGKLRLKG